MRYLIGLLLLTSCATINTPKSLPQSKKFIPPIYSEDMEWIKIPADIKRGPNDCAVLATLINMRSLGITNKDVTITQEEWDAVRFDLGTIAGGTYTKDQVKFWEDKGYEVFQREVKTCGDYADLAVARNLGCSSWRYYWAREDNLAHAEAVIDVVGEDDVCFAKANSWGLKATVKGFSDNNHYHSQLKRYNGPKVNVIDYVICPKGTNFGGT